MQTEPLMLQLCTQSSGFVAGWAFRGLPDALGWRWMLGVGGMPPVCCQAGWTQLSLMRTWHDRVTEAISCSHVPARCNRCQNLVKQSRCLAPMRRRWSCFASAGCQSRPAGWSVVARTSRRLGYCTGCASRRPRRLPAWH